MSSDRAPRCMLAALLAVVFLTAIALYAPAFAQNTSGTNATGASSQPKSKIKPYALIFGTVWNKQDRAVPGVKVRIRRATDKKPKWELISDNNGEFAQRVPAGKADYLVWAEIKGQKGHVAETKVHIDNDERQDIGLHLPE